MAGGSIHDILISCKAHYIVLKIKKYKFPNSLRAFLKSAKTDHYNSWMDTAKHTWQSRSENGTPQVGHYSDDFTEHIHFF